jgi:hypothetical protein
VDSVISRNGAKNRGIIVPVRRRTEPWEASALAIDNRNARINQNHKHEHDKSLIRPYIDPRDNNHNHSHEQSTSEPKGETHKIKN